MAKAARVQWYAASISHDFKRDETEKAFMFSIPDNPERYTYAGYSFWYPKALVTAGNRLFASMRYTKQTEITLYKGKRSFTVSAKLVIADVNKASLVNYERPSATIAL